MNVNTDRQPKGLFAHIQSNNMKCLLLFVGFIVLLQILQIAVFVFQISVSKHPLRVFRIVSQFEMREAHHCARKSDPNEAMACLQSNNLYKSWVNRGGKKDTGGLPAVFPTISSELPGKAEKQEPKVDPDREWSKQDVADTIKQFELHLEQRGLGPRGGFFEELWLDLTVRTGLLYGPSLVILIPAILYVIGGCWLIGYLTRRQTGAHRVERRDEQRLFAVLEPLTISRGLPMPAVEIIETEGRNAYASGFHPTNSAIGVSRGLLDSLNDAELGAVLAHEVAHIENRDNRLMTIAFLCAGTITPLGRKIYNGVRNHPFLGAIFIFWTFCVMPIQAFVLFYGTVLGTFFVAESFLFIMSRKREFVADAHAIEISKEPAALVSALQKISENDKIEGLNPVVQSMMISNLSGVGRKTHPSIDERIAAICSTSNIHAGSLIGSADTSRRADKNVAVRKQTLQNSIQAQPAAPRPVFGRRRVVQGAPVVGRELRSHNRTAHREATVQGQQPKICPQEQKKEDLENNLKKTDKLATKVIHWSLLVYTAPMWLPFVVFPFILLKVKLGLFFWVLAVGLPILGYYWWGKKKKTGDA